MLKCAPIISPDAVRDALDLAENCYLGLEHSQSGEGFFRREFDFTRVTGEMLAGRIKLFGLADSELRGVAGLEDGDTVKLMAVSEEYRRHRLGSALIEALCDEARGNNKNAIFAFATRESAEFFTSLGFKPCEAMEERWGLPVIKVKNDL